MTKITFEEVETYNELQKKIRNRIYEIGNLLNKVNKKKYPMETWILYFNIDSTEVFVRTYCELGWDLGSSYKSMEFPTEYLTMTDEEILEHVK